MEGIWPIVTIIGPVLLIAALIWVYLRNRNPTRAEIERADRGAKRLRDELAEEEAREGER